MGAFAGLISGFSQGAAEQYSKIADEKRQQQIKNDELTAGAIQDKLNDPTLDFESAKMLSRQLWKIRGVPNPVQDQLEAALNHHKADYDTHMAKNQAAQPPMQAPQQTSVGGPVPNMSDQGQAGSAPAFQQSAPWNPGTPGVVGAAPGVSAPGQQLPQTAALPNLPPPPSGMGMDSNPTQGQMKAFYQTPLDVAAETAKFNAQRQARRLETQGDIQDKLDFLDGIDAKVANGTYTKEQAARAYAVAGVKQPGAGGRAITLPGTSSGESLKAKLKEEGAPQAEIDAINPASSYKISLDSARDKIVRYDETERPTRAGQGVIGSSLNGAFSEDAFHAPINPEAMYIPIRAVNGGQVISVMPVSELGSEKAATVVKEVQMQDGTTKLVPVQETSSTVKTVNGRPVQNSIGATPGTAQVAPAPPSPAGTTPETRPTPGQPVPRSATPSTPIPTSGARVGAAITIPGAGKSFTPEQVQANQGLYQAVGATANRLQQVLNNADLLDSPLSAARVKAALSTDLSAQALSRIDGLTPREAKLAALFTSLKEDINTIRKQYNATAFRGPGALEAMQNLAGNPLSNPKVTIATIKQTLESLNAQKKVVEGAMKSHGVDLEPYTRPSDSYKNYAKSPNGHVIGSDNGQNWFDVQTGEAIK